MKSATKLTKIAILSVQLAALAAGPMANAGDLPDLQNQVWPASWITHPKAPVRDHAVLFFRREIELTEVPASYRVHVSADERYRLLVNGTEVSIGPARGDIMNWRYETVDLAPLLRPGANVIAAQVWKLGEGSPWAQISQRLGFVLQGAESASQQLNTGPDWKVLLTDAYRLEPDPWRLQPWVPASTGERVDGKRYPWGWEGDTPPADGWSAPRVIERASPRGARDGTIEMQWLTPGRIPQMERKLERMPRLARASGITADGAFLTGSAPLTIPANQKVELLVDQTRLTMGFPELLVSGGLGAEVKLSYAEALVDDKGAKGHRDEIEGCNLVGLTDAFLPDGGSKRLFRPLWLRTWRYLQLDIQTGDEPLVIDDLRGVFTAYPFEEKATFSSSDPSLHRIWETGWHTTRLCSGETFYDCPYYEQLQYVGDTRIIALITLCVSGDDRLTRNAILDFHESRIADGLTASRYPCRQPQVIPPYSLWWIAMLHDYWLYRDDPAFIGGLLGTADGILRWYEKHIREDGLFRPVGWWNFTDWCDDWKHGEPPGTYTGGSSILALQFAYNSLRAADLFEAFGENDRARHWRDAAGRVRAAVAATCWDATRGLLADTPEKQTFSQHANILAVLTDTLAPDLWQPVMTRVMDDKTLTPCTLYFRFYLNRALQRAGMADLYRSQLKPWHDMLSIGLTTFAETPEPARSDCHAWSACPNYDFLDIICGIRPASPGFKTVEIRPALGDLQWAAASMPHPLGTIEVRFEQRDGGGISADIALPAGLTGDFVWQGKRTALMPGNQRLEP